jgi:hypothetical protein
VLDFAKPGAKAKPASRSLFRRTSTLTQIPEKVPAASSVFNAKGKARAASLAPAAGQKRPPKDGDLFSVMRSSGRGGAKRRKTAPPPPLPDEAIEHGSQRHQNGRERSVSPTPSIAQTEREDSVADLRDFGNTNGKRLAMKRSRSAPAGDFAIGGIADGTETRNKVVRCGCCCEGCVVAHKSTCSE